MAHHSRKAVRRYDMPGTVPATPTPEQIARRRAFDVSQAPDRADLLRRFPYK